MSTFNRNTLVKVLEILDSSHAQEALAAAKLASAMVREAGLTWDQVIDDAVLPRAAAPSPAQRPVPPARPAPDRSAIAASASCRRTSSSSWCC